MVNVADPENGLPLRSNVSKTTERILMQLFHENTEFYADFHHPSDMQSCLSVRALLRVVKFLVTSTLIAVIIQLSDYANDMFSFNA